MGGALEEVRQRSRALARTLVAESTVRTRETGSSACLTELTGIVIAEERKHIQALSVIIDNDKYGLIPHETTVPTVNRHLTDCIIFPQDEADMEASHTLRQ